MLCDGAFDAKPILNTIASKDTYHKEGFNKPKGIRSKDKG
jgi:hypothetical protein